MTAVYILDLLMGFLLLIYCGVLIYLIKGSYHRARKREDNTKSYFECLDNWNKTDYHDYK